MTKKACFFKSFGLLIHAAALAIIFQGCATDENLTRSYNLLNERIDTSQGQLAATFNREMADARRQQQAEITRLSKEIDNLRKQAILDLEVSRAEIQKAATSGELKQAVEASARSLEGMEKKLLAAMDSRIIATRNEIFDLNNRQSALNLLVVELSSNFIRHRGEATASDVEIARELKRLNETFSANIDRISAEMKVARQDLEKTSGTIARNREDIQLSAAEIEKQKKEISELSRILESSRVELEQHRTEFLQLAEKLAANQALLAESRGIIDKSQEDLGRMTRELGLSQSAGADLIADVTVLKQKIMDLSGSVELFQRGQAQMQEEQKTQKLTLQTLSAMEKKLQVERESREGDIRNLKQQVESLASLFDAGENVPLPRPAAAVPAKEGHKEAAPPPLAPDAPEEAVFRRAFESFQTGHYERAREEFRIYLTRFPRGESAESAQFWLAESFFLEKQFERAIVEYEKVVKNFSGGARTPHALLKQGISFQSLRDIPTARLYYEQVLAEHPHSTPARLARIRLLEMK